MSLRRRRREAAGDQEIAELAALADGSLPADRQAELQARVDASPELADRLSEQQHAVALAQTAAAETVASDRLRARIDAERQRRRSPAPRRVAFGVAVTAGVAAASIVAVVALSSSADSQRFQAALGPTPLAPAATGDATLVKTSSGWRIELDAKGLPRLDGGRFYEAWLRNSTGVLAPVGTFNEPRKVTLWAGVSPIEYSTLTVTRERADGDQASSGERVLTGKIMPRS